MIIVRRWWKFNEVVLSKIMINDFIADFLLVGEIRATNRGREVKASGQYD